MGEVPNRGHVRGNHKLMFLSFSFPSSLSKNKINKIFKLVNFCVAILILKVEEIHNIFGILFFIISRKVKTQLKRKKQICAVYGEGAVTDGMCQKWFVKFCAGDFSLDDAPWSGRPVEVDRDQTKKLIENNKHCTMLEIANILKISKSIKL